MEDGEQAKKEEAEEKEESGPTSNSLSYEWVRSPSCSSLPSLLIRAEL